MTVNLSSIGMREGQHYESIITSQNNDKKANAAPIGIICKSENEILCRIFKGSNTLNNIEKQNEFVFNITQNPLYFTLSTIGNLEEKYFEYNDNRAFLKDSEAYVKCTVNSIKEGIKNNDPIRKSEIGIITATVTEIIKNKKYVQAPNRGFYSLIESLINFTRINIVDKQQQDYYIGRFRESERVINKVGNEEQKKAIDLLKNTIKEKGYEV
ncbi:DUF447 domain-containing protein [Methanobrevibacter filiformis]|uniref:DUF447 family protein n=1 Tax=Methanobrevibacter filiformis TaxID=55758 RepID=A0A166F5L6_9EURY|nr:DUF447 domain-containing protein [Methanobrevibacter filiformis]KZX17339.1 hypothetical protein MBFIL_02080 [Methanobrevibacter filiformis]